MERKEQIILATLDLAKTHGLTGISMSQIAKKVGIQKPSLYNHFKSKEELISSIYSYIRANAKKNINDIDISEFIKTHSVKDILLESVNNYIQMNKSENLFSFYKVIYAERAINKEAANIIIEETERMIRATKTIFYALQVHGKINISDIDTAATSFAMTVHSIMDYQFDCESVGITLEENMMERYITWFCKNIEAN